MMIHTSMREYARLRTRRRRRMKWRRWMGEWRQTPSKPRHFGPRARWRWSIAAYEAWTPF